MKVFGNDIPGSIWRKCLRKRDHYAKKFNYSDSEKFSYFAAPDPFVGKLLGTQRLISAVSGESPTPEALGKLASQARPVDLSKDDKAILLGTIRMGYGHYRMALAAASAAHAMGYTPYWLDFISVKDSTASKVIVHLNYWYSLASRLSQKSKLFNDLFWEKATSEWSRPISYYAENMAFTELFKNVCTGFPADTPFIASHAWCAQAAVHANMTNVVHMIPDNWPLSFHLAEGAVMAVQSSSCYTGYRQLRNMGLGKDVLPNNVPAESLRFTGHYVDHEIVSNIKPDCDRRRARMRAKKPRRILMTIGGAGAQQGIFEGVIRHLMPLLRERRLLLCVNMGDHRLTYESMLKNLALKPDDYVLHSDWAETQNFAKSLLTREATGLHIFTAEEIMPAVYTTNLLMRAVDFMMTKPSELSYYPVPKLFVQRVGRFEAWGAIRGAEIGDGTLETETLGKLYQTLGILLESDDLLNLYCDNIEKNASIGMYDGAYNLIKIIEENRKAARKAAAKPTGKSASSKSGK
jgi:hypothetical protein